MSINLISMIDQADFYLTTIAMAGNAQSAPPYPRSQVRGTSQWQGWNGQGVDAGGTKIGT